MDDVFAKGRYSLDLRLVVDHFVEIEEPLIAEANAFYGDAPWEIGYVYISKRADGRYEVSVSVYAPRKEKES